MTRNHSAWFDWNYCKLHQNENTNLIKMIFCTFFSFQSLGRDILPVVGFSSGPSFTVDFEKSSRSESGPYSFHDFRKTLCPNLSLRHEFKKKFGSWSWPWREHRHQMFVWFVFMSTTSTRTVPNSTTVRKHGHFEVIRGYIWWVFFVSISLGYKSSLFGLNSHYNFDIIKVIGASVATNSMLY